MLRYTFSEFPYVQVDNILPIWAISCIFKEHILSIFWDILCFHSIYGPKGKEVVREDPEEILYDFMRQILPVKSMYDFLLDGGRGTSFTSKDVF